MKNIPKRIFIQAGDGSEIAGEFDFEKLVCVTWSTERKNKADLEYILKKDSDDKIKEIISVLRKIADNGSVIRVQEAELLKKTLESYDRRNNTESGKPDQ